MLGKTIRVVEIVGLDQYLRAKIYLNEYSNDKDGKKRAKIKKIFPEMFGLGNLETVEIKFEAGYWRKSNHIHKWFVDNCQDGKDECQDSYVGREDLEKLKLLCEKILNNKELAKDILPTQAGFFFGGNEYNEWYFDGIEETIEIITKCLKLPKEWNFEYHASW